jgi:hypothetical protein
MNSNDEARITNDEARMTQKATAERFEPLRPSVRH